MSNDEISRPLTVQVDSLVRVSQALSNFEYIMKQPRMDSDNQRNQALETLKGVWDRQTQKDFRVVISELRNSNVTCDQRRVTD